MELSKNKLVLIDPYNEEHIMLIKQFEQELENHLPYQLSDILCHIRNSQPQKEYEENKKKQDKIEENLYLVHHNKLVSSCFIEGSRKKKSCTFTYLTLPKYQGQGFASQLLELAFDYVSSFLEVDTVELDIHRQNEASIKTAEKAGFVLMEEIGVQKIYKRSVVKKVEELKRL